LKGNQRKLSKVGTSSDSFVSVEGIQDLNNGSDAEIRISIEEFCLIKMDYGKIGIIKVCDFA
jgi:hypothetical protein